MTATAQVASAAGAAATVRVALTSCDIPLPEGWRRTKAQGSKAGTLINSCDVLFALFWMYFIVYCMENVSTRYCMS